MPQTADINIRSGSIFIFARIDGKKENNYR
jgi:hypothetical protein